MKPVCCNPLIIRYARNKEGNMVKLNDKTAWWRKARFGMFIHWGLYAIHGGRWKGRTIPGPGEWIMAKARIPATEYEQLAARFNPVKFDARAWVKLAKDAGMKYLVITAKHHDGFAMFNSPSNNYNIVAATPWGHDPLRELARACRAAGIRFCFYYSQFNDWHDPDAHGNTWDFPDGTRKNFSRYMRRKCLPQVRELLTQYGPVGLIWFDTPGSIKRGHSLELRRLTRRLQPDCLINGRLGHDLGDYDGLADNQLPAVPTDSRFETAVTINDSWGFKKDDRNWKSAETLITQLVECASKGANYLLNVGPDSTGVIPRPNAARLRKIGRWLKINGEAIYDTQPSPFPYDFAWGRITRRANRLYLHFFKWPAGGEFTLHGLRSRVRRARLMAKPSTPIPVCQQHDRKHDEHVVHISLPRRKPARIIPVVALDLEGRPDADPLPQEQMGGHVMLPVNLAVLRAPKGVSIGPEGTVRNWRTSAPQLHWTFNIRKPGLFRVVVETWLDRLRAERYGTHQVKVTVGRETARGRAGRADFKIRHAGNRYQTAQSDIGLVNIASTGAHTATLLVEKYDPKDTARFDPVGLRLVRVKNAKSFIKSMKAGIG